jgi:TetR/AcrR family fatty acid metabolism transcriptional regulator
MRSETQTVDQPKVSFIEQARRAQIIDCAIEAIAELGFAQASLAQIAKRAGVSTGVILYYFAGKDDLIGEVIRHVFAKGAEVIGPEVNAQDDPREALLAFIRGNVAFFRDYPHYGRAVMNITRSGVAAGFDEFLDRPRRDGFRSILEWGQRIGAFRPFSVDVMSTSIVEAMDIIPRRHFQNPELDFATYADELVTLFDRATRADSPTREDQP